MQNIPKMGSVGGDSLYDSSKIRGVREERGIVEGIVKANVHKANMGVISVWVPRYSSDENDSDEWRQVRYCTPYYSRTSVVDPNNNFLNVKQTAGIVTPPPDIGTTVLCVFPEGRTADGYYFACVPDLYMMQTLPEATVDIHNSGSVPVISAEFNDSPAGPNPTSSNKFVNWKKPAAPRPEDEITQAILKKQGLDRDFVRGLSTSNYMRESPSELMGFSTKGRRIDSDGEDLLKKYESEIIGGTDSKDIQDKLLGPKYRRKGHSITLDDGDFKGNSNQIRLRTSTGHQILMNDSEGIIYISNADGSSWIELGKNGTMDVYAEDSINFRTKNINFHADENIKMHSKGFTQFVSEKQFHIQAKEELNMFTEREAGLTAMSGFNLFSNSSMKLTSTGPGYFNAGSFASIKGSLVLLQGPSSPAKTVKPVQQAQRLDVEQGADANDGFAPTTSVVTSVDRTVSHEPYLGHGMKNSSSEYTGGLQGAGGGLGGIIQIVSAAVKIAGTLPASDASYFGDLGANPGGAFVEDLDGNIVMGGGKPVLAGVDLSATAPTSSFDIGSKFGDFGSDIFGELPSGDGFFSGVSEWWADSGLSEFGSEVYDTVSSFGSEIQAIGGQFIGDVKGFTTEFQQITNEVKGEFASLGAELDSVVPGSSAYLTEVVPINKIDTLAQVLNTPVIASISLNDVAAMDDTGFQVGALDAEQILAVGAVVTKAVGANGAYNYIDSTTKAVGKYGHTVQQLYDSGFVSGEAVFNDQLGTSTNWTGKQNINSIEDYLANPHVQELVQQGVLVHDYQALVNLGAITPQDDAGNVMAMLTSSMTSTPDIAAKVRKGENAEGIVRNTTNIPVGTDAAQWVQDLMGKGAAANSVVKGSSSAPAGLLPFTGTLKPGETLRNINGKSYVVPASSA